MSDILTAAVVGAGPAGLAAAINLARSGFRVRLFEQRDRAGSKLLITGGTRCNITNALKTVPFARSFGEKRWRFVLPALKNFSPETLQEFFNSRSTFLEFPDGFHCFPASGKAADILETLLAECRKLGVIFEYRRKVSRLCVSEGKICAVECGPETFRCDIAVIASGGKSYPGTGATGSGYALAQELGHRIITPVPGMVGLRCQEEFPPLLSGITLSDAESSIALPGEKQRCRGGLLFTRQGISGFAVLDISARVAELLLEYPVVPLKINLFASESRESFLELFQQWQLQHGTQSVGKLLSAYLPRKMLPFICPCPEKSAARFDIASRRITAQNLTALTLHIHSTDGWEKAQVTRGGVDIAEVDPETMQSRMVKGLFFAGEVLDIDGPCGGYNLQWALSSGFRICAKQA